MNDAAGNAPKALTKHERRWRESVSGGDLQRRLAALKDRQALPLKDKIALSESRIREWIDAWGGKVAVSFSGGKDSAVLLHLVRKIAPETPAAFCNTGLEYPEVAALAKNTPNTTTIRPKIPFHHVIRDHGWPVISKKVARGLSVLKNPTEKNQNIYRLYDEGVNRFGEPVNGFKVPDRWRFLIDAPFPISDKCCAIMKKDPMTRYERRTGLAQMVGTMAADSKQRERAYLQSGCNAFDMKRPRSAPMSFWTEQDVLQYIAMHNVPTAAVYGDIRQCPDTGRLSFTGVHSTGCVFCCFGLQREETPNRFQRLHDSHPSLWRFCVDKLGLGEVLDWMRTHCPSTTIRRAFHYKPSPGYDQMELF